MNRQEQISPQESEDIKNIKKLSHIREMRAKEILKIGDPELLSNEEFLVPSSNGIDKYKVVHLDAWSCECKDFKEYCREKGIYCKHIKAMQQFLKLRNSAEIENFDVIGLNGENALECPTCKSLEITKQGYRINKNSKKHKYFCGNCSRYFVNEPVKYIKGNTQLLCLAMDCYYKGLSLRDIQDTFKQFYGIKLHHETIRRWIMKFTEKINNYVETKTPELGKSWNTDEQMIKIKGKWKWSWNTIDKETRFWIANNVTKGRTEEEARQQFKKVKNTAKNQRPDIMVTDGLLAYKKAIKKEFVTHKDNIGRPRKNSVLHIGNAGFKKPINNNIVERLHGEFREFDKVRRGFKADKTAEQWLNGMKLYHNFIKPHSSLKGATPSQKANIDLKLGNNRWLGLLKESVKGVKENEI